MKSLFERFRKNKLSNSNVDIDDNLSDTSSDISTPEYNTQYNPKTKERINRLIKNLSQSPDAFNSVLTKLETGNFSFFRGEGLTKLVGKDLAGKRYDIFTAAGLLYTTFGKKGMLPGLLRNGLLTELASIDRGDAATILNIITEHNFFKENMMLLGINESNIPASQVKGIVNSFVGLINTINKSNPKSLLSLGGLLADFVENNQKMEKLQEKLKRNNKKLESYSDKAKYTAKIALLEKEISILEKNKSSINTQIINNIINNLESKESRDYITAFTLLTASSLAKSLDKLDISEEKTSALEKIQKYNEQIKKLEEAKGNVTSLTNERDSLIERSRITIFEQLTYLTRKTIKLNPNAKLDDLLSLAEPTISAVFSHPQELYNITAALQTFAENPKEQLSNLAFTAMSLLKHDDVLSSLIDPETIIKVNEALGSDKVSLANKFIDIFSADSAIDNIMGDEGLEPILLKTLDLQKVQQFLKLSPQDAEQFKTIVPDVTNYLKSVTKALIPQETEIKDLAYAFQSYSEAQDKAEKLPSLVNSAVNLLGQPDIINAVFDNQIATKILELPKAQQLLKISPQEAEQFKTIVPDAINYLKSVTKALMPHAKEISALTSALQSYSEAQDKAEKLPSIVNSAVNLLGQPDVMEALSNEENINNLLSKASKIPKMKDFFIKFKKDLSPLKLALKDATPKLIEILKVGIESEDNKKLLIKAEALLYSQDKTKLRTLAIEAIDLYSKNPQILNSMIEKINESKEDLSKIIDESLFAIKKDSYTLRLLKPLGINGDFITSMLTKTINEKGLEALKNFIDHPSGINAINIISSTGNLSLVVNHAFKNGFNYLIGKKNTAALIPTESLKTEKPIGWTKRVTESSKNLGSKFKR